MDYSILAAHFLSAVHSTFVSPIETVLLMLQSNISNMLYIFSSGTNVSGL